jgi:sterol 3beta-glucosyltransferase
VSLESGIAISSSIATVSQLTRRFWADAIHRAGAGSKPIKPKHLDITTLSEAFEFIMQPEVKEQAGKIGEDMRNEQGEKKGVDSFHRHLPLLNMR